MDKEPVNQILLDVYQRLLAYYGPQHWWPAEEPFEVMVGAILTQSTSWKNVEKAIINLKAAGVLSPAGLRRLGLAALAQLIRPSGYYHAKSLKLKSLVNWLEESCRDDISQLSLRDTDQLREGLLAVHGIGEETADSIILYAIGQPVFVIDAYTRRIIDHLGLSPCRQRYVDYQALLTKNLPLDTGLFNEYHALLVCLGKSICRKTPLCQHCCLSHLCPSNPAV